jgi:hypothetical protein
MLQALADMMAADLAAVQSELGVSMTWDQAVYQVIRDSIETAREGTMHGIHLDADLMVYCVSADFDDGEPALGDLVTIGGTNYRVMRKADHPASAGFRLWLQETNR